MSRVPNQPSRPLDGLTRRNFLTASGAVGAAAALAGLSNVTFADLAKAAENDPLPVGSPILVIVTMYGGNDSLNTVIPYKDPAYLQNRPQMGWKENEVLKLDGQFGLNPGMTGLAKLWGEKKLSIVHGAGYPRPDHSHFRSMDIWQTGSAETAIRTGWVGRYLDAARADATAGLHIGGVLPLLGAGAASMMATLSPSDRASVSGTDPLHDLALPDPKDSPAQKAVQESYAAAERARTQLANVTKNLNANAGGNLSAAMGVVASCIKANVPTRVYSTAIGGFDTHANERGQQKNLLAAVDAGIMALRTALAGSPREKDVVVMCYSEFGRRVRANGSQGTDHGTAGNILLVGDKVKPGFHGEAPSLTNLDNGDLKATTDFRSVYSEILTKMLKVDPGAVLKGKYPDLGTLA